MHTELQELIRNEEYLHRPPSGATNADLQNLLSENFFEVGASGKRFDRSQALAVLERRRSELDHAPRTASNFAALDLGNDTTMLHYSLEESGRRTFRSTVWRRRDSRWQAVFHQGTVVPDA